MLETITKPNARVRAKKTYPEGIRDFTPDDRDAVIEIFEKVGWPAEVDRRHYDVRLVATVDGTVAAHMGIEFRTLRGCLGCDECDGTPHARRGARAYLDTVAVHPDFRGLGLAKSLLHAAKLVARRRGLPWLELDVGRDNTAALALYQAAGFRPHDLGVDAWLVDPDQVRLRRRA